MERKIVTLSTGRTIHVSPYAWGQTSAEYEDRGPMTAEENAEGAEIHRQAYSAKHGAEIAR